MNRYDKARLTSALRVAIASAAVLLLLALCINVRAQRYRQTIFHYQQMIDSLDPNERESLKVEIEETVGRPNYPWYRLPKAPRYKHFWDEYNTINVYDYE